MDKATIEPIIEFSHGGGFAGASYQLGVNDKWYQLCTNLGGVNGAEQAKKIAIEKLAELGIKYDKEIIFKRNGFM